MIDAINAGDRLDVGGADATSILRRMLDERGVEHYDGIESTLWLKDEHGYRASANELTSGQLSVHIWCDTPEQAIAATLGSGECEIETTENWLPAERYHRCRHCGAFFAVMNASWDIQPCACPNCGKAVKQ